MPDFNPDLDLKIERLIKAKPQTIWRCWAEADLFKRWFTPPSVDVVEAENILEPGGRCYNLMRLPDGTEMPNEGVFLVADPYERLIYTDAMQAGFRPVGSCFMTADVTLTPQDGGTLYHAHVMHPTAEGRQSHEEMGFHEGWGTTLDQLADLASGLG